MKRVQLAVYYRQSLCSYIIDFNDDGLYRFTLVSTPAGIKAPDAVTVQHKPGKWTFTPSVDAEFRQAVKTTIRLMHNR
jgi:hypothetical protein